MNIIYNSLNLVLALGSRDEEYNIQVQSTLVLQKIEFIIETIFQ